MIQYLLTILITLGISTAYWFGIAHCKTITLIVVLLIAVLLLVYVIKSEFNSPKRVSLGESYFYIDMDGSAQVCIDIDRYTEHNDCYWHSGNYFNTLKEAEKYAKRINKLLIERTL